MRQRDARASARTGTPPLPAQLPCPTSSATRPEQPLGIVTTRQDISERWEAEEALRRARALRPDRVAQDRRTASWDWNLAHQAARYFSPRWKGMLGPRRHGSGHGHRRVVPAASTHEDRDRVQRKIQDHLPGS